MDVNRGIENKPTSERSWCNVLTDDNFLKMYPTFVMRLVQFYMITILITMNFRVCFGSGYFAPKELEYLSKRLYPIECSYLTTTLLKSFLKNCQPLNQSSDDTLADRPELHCLLRLNEWNEIALQDEKARERIERILHEIGRPDLAAYLSKKMYSPYSLS